MPRGFARVGASALALGLAVWASQASAAINWGEEYARRIKASQEVGPLSDDAFGDNISLYTGAVTFSAVDVSIPGNNALPVEIRRVYNPADMSNPGILETNSDSAWSLDFPRMFMNWDLDIPYISEIVAATNADDGFIPVPPDNVSNNWMTFRRQWYWRGYHLYAGAAGGGGEILNLTDDPRRVRPTGTGMLGLVGTKDGWQFSGTTPLPRYTGGPAVPGAAYIGHAPNGNKYYFNWLVERDELSITHRLRSGYVNGANNVLRRKKLYLYVSRIEDRFGNWVQYKWNKDVHYRVDEIVSSDGRSIKLDYKQFGLGGRWYVDTVTAKHGTDPTRDRVWTYKYDGELTKVINPDLSAWQYARTGYRLDMIEYREDRDANNIPFTHRNDEVPCAPANQFVGNPTIYAVTHPSGAKATYTFKATRHGRTNVQFVCMTGYDGDTGHTLAPTFQDVMSLQSKVISGPGLDTGTYTYAYGDLTKAGLEDYTKVRQGFQAQDESVFPFEPGWNAQFAPEMPNYKLVRVTEPDGTEQVHTFGKDWEVSEGQLLKSVTRKGGETYKTVTNAYVSNTEAASLPNTPPVVGISPVQWSDDFPTWNRPLKSTVITQDGATFSSKVAISGACGGTYCFDGHARATSTVKSSSLGYIKSDDVEFHDDLSRWILGQVEATTSNGIEVDRTVFDGNSMPKEIHKYGKLQEKLAYNFDGTLATITDGNGNVTVLSGWMRGIPTRIQHPATPEIPNVLAETAVVSTHGTIDESTDESGARTCYEYDLMLRLTKSVPLAGAEDCKSATTVWNPTLLAFGPAGSGEYGLPAGYWKQTVKTGNGLKTTYLDALWRPRLTREEDLGNAATVRVSARKFDTKGRVTDDYYPKDGSFDQLSDFTQGTHTSYDALGRVTEVRQDSELGILTTKTAYESPFVRRVTNPRNQVTVQQFMAYDTPTYDLPVQIDAPQNTRTTIVRDTFGKPVELNRGPGN